MDPADLEKLFSSEGPKLLRRLRGFRGRVSEEDVLQTAFARMLEADLTRIEDPKAYLARLVRNLAIDEVRIQNRGLIRSESDDKLEELEENLARPAIGRVAYDSANLSPEEMLIAGERTAHMTAVVMALPYRERTALFLHKSEGLSHKEIGERLGVSQHSIPRYLAKALAKCAKALATFEDGALAETLDPKRSA